MIEDSSVSYVRTLFGGGIAQLGAVLGACQVAQCGGVAAVGTLTDAADKVRIQDRCALALQQQLSTLLRPFLPEQSSPY